MLLGINLIFGSLREVFNKKVADKLDPYVGLFYITLFINFWFYIYQIIIIGSLPQFNLLQAASGIVIAAAAFSYFSALKISLSQSILFQSYSIIVTIMLAAIFLGEGSYFDIGTVTGIKVISGIILAITALWFLLHVGSKKEVRLERKWFVYIIFTILFFGVGSFFSVSLTRTNVPVEVLINQENVMVVIFFVLSLWQKKKILIGKKLVFLTFINSIFATVAIISFFEALRIVAVARFFPIQQLSLVVLTMLSAVVFYKESNIFSGKRLIGMAMGLVGIILLVTS